MASERTQMKRLATITRQESNMLDVRLVLLKLKYSEDTDSFHDMKSLRTNCLSEYVI